ncbi:MAG: sugar phosphate isomerase/epimerase family protein [Verrucomicrobiota bacterium]
MIFGLTTRWNAARHVSGEAMIEEILGLGFDHVELGYDLRIDLVPGVQKMVSEGAVKVESVHNYCPVPVGAPKGHPELFTFADPDRRIRERAIHYTLKTARFAAEVGAKVVIAHAGNVYMKRFSRMLQDLHEKGEHESNRYEKTKFKLQVVREKRVKKQFEYLREALGHLLPLMAETGVQLALENLPTWESIPTELEMEMLCKEFGPQNLRYWHDIGHAQIRQNLGFINQERWLERLSPFLAGMHIHDVGHPVADHLMPSAGQVDFAALKRFARRNILRIIEPSPNTPTEKVIEGLRFIRQAWEDQKPAATQGNEGSG